MGFSPFWHVHLGSFALFGLIQLIFFFNLLLIKLFFVLFLADQYGQHRFLLNPKMNICTLVPPLNEQTNK